MKVEYPQRFINNVPNEFQKFQHYENEGFTILIDLSEMQKFLHQLR